MYIHTHPYSAFLIDKFQKTGFKFSLELSQLFQNDGINDGSSLIYK